MVIMRHSSANILLAHCCICKVNQYRLRSQKRVLVNKIYKLLSLVPTPFHLYILKNLGGGGGGGGGDLEIKLLNV